jgi:hypothetical protein
VPARARPSPSPARTPHSRPLARPPRFYALHTPHPPAAQLQEYEEQTFGVCPRFFCHNASCLPVGTSNASDHSLVKLFCPRCEELYSLPDDHPSTSLDGAFFGPTFAHVLLLVNPHFLGGKTGEAYRPKIYGFAVMNQLGRSDLVSEAAAASLRSAAAAPSFSGSTLTGYDGDRETLAGGGASAFSGASAGLSVGVGAGAGAGAGAAMSLVGGIRDFMHGGGFGFVGAMPVSAHAEAQPRTHRKGPLTTFYDGARPEEDDFFSSDDEPQPRSKRQRV